MRCTNIREFLTLTKDGARQALDILLAPNEIAALAVSDIALLCPSSQYAVHKIQTQYCFVIFLAVVHYAY